MGVRFNASGDNLRRNTNLPSITAFTMMGWFKIVVDTNAYVAFLSFGGSSAPYYAVETDTNGTTLALWNGSTFPTGSNLTVGTWYHLTLIVDGTGAGNCRLYLNGNLDITNSGNASISAARMYVGNDLDLEYLNGIAECVKVWNRALSVGEIQQEMWSRLPGTTTDLRFWLLLDENDSNTVARDFSGGGYDFTVNGTLEQQDGSPIITTSAVCF